MLDKSWGKQLNCDVVFYISFEKLATLRTQTIDENNCIQQREGLVPAQN